MSINEKDMKRKLKRVKRTLDNHWYLRLQKASEEYRQIAYKSQLRAHGLVIKPTPTMYIHLNDLTDDEDNIEEFCHDVVKADIMKGRHRRAMSSP